MSFENVLINSLINEFYVINSWTYAFWGSQSLSVRDTSHITPLAFRLVKIN